MRHAKSDYIFEMDGYDGWRYVRAVPVDVRKALGRTKWNLSLGTANRAEAVRLARVLAVQHDGEIAAAKRQDPMKSLSTEQKGTLQDAGGVDGYLKFLESRMQDAAKFLDDARNWREWAASESRGVPESKWEHAVGWGEDVPDPDCAQTEIDGLVAKEQSIRAQINREAPLVRLIEASGATVPKTLAAAVKAAPAPMVVAVADAGMTLSGLCEKFIADNSKREAVKQKRNHVRIFEEVNGVLPLAQYQKMHMRAFRDYLATDAGLGTVTAKQYFGSVQRLFRWAVSETSLESSPGAGVEWQNVPVKFSEVRQNKKRSFSVAECVAILKQVDALPDDRHKSLDTRWFVKVLMFSGMRAEEVAQLTPGDVVVIQGARFFDVYDRGPNRVKNKAAVRRVPVHPWLIAAGFLEFAKAREGSQLLFATLARDDGGRIYPRMANRLRYVIRDQCGITDSKVTPHGWRHGFQDALRLANVPDEIADSLMGRTNKARMMARHYGESQPLQLAEWMAKTDPLDPKRHTTTYAEKD